MRYMYFGLPLRQQDLLHTLYFFPLCKRKANQYDHNAADNAYLTLCTFESDNLP